MEDRQILRSKPMKEGIKSWKIEMSSPCFHVLYFQEVSFSGFLPVFFDGNRAWIRVF
jgi:hypothetical protein